MAPLRTSDIAAEAERLLQQITPGDWRISMTGYSVKSNDDDMPFVAQNPWGQAMREKDIPCWLANAEFIAAAPRIIRVLLNADEQREREAFMDGYGAAINGTTSAEEAWAQRNTR